MNSRSDYTHVSRLHLWLASLLVVLLAALMTSCMYSPFSPFANDMDRAMAAQPESPLIPGQNTPLAQHDWRIVEASRAGRPIQIAAIAPVLLSFEAKRGLLGVHALYCNAASAIIVASDAHHYRLVPAESTAKHCGTGQQQENDLHAAVLATTEYELRGNQLILSGQDVRIVAEIEPPS